MVVFFFFWLAGSGSVVAQSVAHAPWVEKKKSLIFPKLSFSVHTAKTHRFLYHSQVYNCMCTYCTQELLICYLWKLWDLCYGTSEVENDSVFFLGLVVQMCLL